MDSRGAERRRFAAPVDVPLDELARSISNSLGALGRDVPWQVCRERLELGDGALKELARDLLDAAGGAVGARGVLLSIDQGEKLVTQCSDRQRVALLDLLADGLAGASRLLLHVDRQTSSYLPRAEGRGPRPRRELPEGRLPGMDEHEARQCGHHCE